MTDLPRTNSPRNAPPRTDLTPPDHDLLGRSRAAGPFTGARLIDPRPGITGRWQPTRAGAVNSWAWADEQFLFHNGWSALVGPNGSGKSVTGEMLFPTLIDGDVTPKGLSIPGIAKGTLGDRHTNGNPRSAKTGLWWQEFGHIHPGHNGDSDGGDGKGDSGGAEPETDWLTVGLWLHRGAGAKSQVDRAWFLAPARVDQDLVLTQDRDPVTIEQLAQQLTACGGRLFTSTDRLAKAATQHLSVVTREHDFRDAVRDALYAPMDHDQVDALTAVLRALRSVQVNQRISPESMQETLTSALPSLDINRVERLAQALTKTEQLQQQLRDARDERDTLTPILSAYRRYAGAVAALTAARMLEAWRHHHRQTTRHQELERQRHHQQRVKDAADRAAVELHEVLRQLDQTIDVLRQKASGHKGAGLPQLEQHATQLESNAAETVQVAEHAAQEAEQARRTSGEHDERAHRGVAHVRSLIDEMAEDARQAHAAAYGARIAETTDIILREEVAEDSQQGQQLIEEANATVQAWAASRLAALTKVREATIELRAAQQARREAEDRVATARAEADTAAADASVAHEEVQHAEATTTSRLHEFTGALRRLPPPPAALLDTTPLDLDAIIAWADTELREAITLADVAGARARAESAADAEAHARRESNDAHTVAAAAEQDADTSAAALLTRAGHLPEPPPQIAALAAALRALGNTTATNTATNTVAAGELLGLDSQIATLATASRQELATRKDALRQASVLLGAFDRAHQQSEQDAATAQQAVRAAEAARRAADHAQRLAAQETIDWVRGVRAWADTVRVIDLSRLRLPAPEQDGIADPDRLDAEVAEAHRLASTKLAAELATAEATRTEASAACDRLDADIAAAEQTDPAPDAPPWRPDRVHRAGAPLWALVDFADSLPTEHAGQLEGALLAAGLLDAWVSTDGTLAAGDLHLVPSTPLAGRTLAHLLVPDPGSVVPADQVHALLASIRVTDSEPNNEPHHPPGEPDDGASVVVDLAGTARAGLLAARAPADWAPRHIGPTARERNRQRRLAELHRQRTEREAALTRATTLVEHLRADIAQAERERAALPLADELVRLRREAGERAAEAHRSAETAETAANAAHRSADQAHAAQTAATEACRAAWVAADLESVESAMSACADLPELVTSAELRGQKAVVTALAARTRAREADEAATRRSAANQAVTQAQQAADEAMADRDQLPETAFSLLRQRRQNANEASRKAAEAADRVTAAQAELQRRENIVHQALAALHQAAQTQDGYTVPTDPTHVTALRHRVETLKEQAMSWVMAAGRAQTLSAMALEHRRIADRAHQRAGDTAARAQRLTSDARAARHRYDEERRLHGSEYQQLLDELATRRREHELKTAARTQQQDNAHTAALRLATIEANLDGVEERCRQAEQERDHAVDALRLLFDEGLIADVLIADVADAETLARPDTADAATTVAEAILTGRGLTAEEPVSARDTAVARALRDLDSRIRNVRDTLFRLGRHIELEEVSETGWRRVVVTEQSHTTASATSTKSLHALLDDLERAVHTLESDFDEQLRTEVKGAIFTDLRKHINVRIALAEQIVADIQQTLKGVRTGVARVGIELGWQPRDNDPVAAEAISLIRGAKSEGEFDRMYDFFIRLLGAEDQTTTSAERIQQVFDYRTWYQWQIRVTHTEFTRSDHTDDDDHTNNDGNTNRDDSGEVFRKVTSRKNPLDTLSTGEKRLATMLPLLAAARAFYSADGYHGPRMIFIDELDAAFDRPNLRMMLALLRDWEFDVMTTLPSMPPLLAAEAGAVAIHKIGKHTDKHGEGYRYTVPCIWEGHGQPHAARIHVVAQATHRRDHTGVSALHPDRDPAQSALFDTNPGIT